MNGIERITQRIQQDAETEIGQVLEAARSEAAQITARYESQVERERAALQAKAEKQAAEHEERLVSVAQMEARKVTLAAKQAVVEKAYDRALEILRSMSEEEYVSVAADLMIAASTTGREQVIFSPEDRETIGTAAVAKANQISGKHLFLAKETRPLNGGFIMRNQRIEINCAFDTLVRLRKAETVRVVAKKLFI